MSASICIVYVLELCCAKKNIVLYFCNWQISQTWGVGGASVGAHAEGDGVWRGQEEREEEDDGTHD